MERYISVKTPRGATLTINLDLFTKGVINNELLIILAGEEFQVAGTEEELENILYNIQNKKNKYDTEMYNITLRNDIIREASDKAVSFGQEILRETVLNSFKDVATSMKKELEEAVSTNKEIIKLLKEAHKEINSMKKRVSSLKEEVDTLRYSLFQEEG